MTQLDDNTVPHPPEGQNVEHAAPPGLPEDPVAQAQPEPRQVTPPAVESAAVPIDQHPQPLDHVSQNQNPAPPPPDPVAEASAAAVWPTKLITWPPRSESKSLIVMQSRNGPCSLIALCNVLILRSDIKIEPEDRRSVSYEYLANLIADYLVSHITDDGAFEGLSAALSKLPTLQEGMDVNSVWSNHSSFKQLGDGGELKVFELCKVELVHGWLADPSSAEYDALIKVADYDGAVNLIVEADHLTKGRLVESDVVQAEGTRASLDLTDEQHKTVHDALIIRNFLEANSSQLTYAGLFDLSTNLQPGLYALFRNSHLSVLYKAGEEGQPLYTLVTDSVFTREQDVVWETLEDVDGSASTFVDAHLVRSSTAGGDYSGRSAEAAVRDAERQMENLELDPDAALARQLQAEEDQIAREHRRAYRAQQQQQSQRGQGPDPEEIDARLRPLQDASSVDALGRERRISNRSSNSRRGKSDCIIM